MPDLRRPPMTLPPTPAPHRGPTPHRIGFTLSEIAEVLNVTPRTVRDWVRAGRVAVVGTERKRLVTPAALADAFGPDVARAMLEMAAAEGRPVYVPAESAA